MSSSYLIKDDSLFITQNHAHQFEWSVLKTDNCNNNSNNNNNSHNDIKQLNILVTEQYDHDLYTNHILNIVQHIPDTITTVVITYSHNSNNCNTDKNSDIPPISVETKRIIKLNKSLLDLQYRIQRLLYTLDQIKYLDVPSFTNRRVELKRDTLNPETRLLNWSVDQEIKHYMGKSSIVQITDTTSPEYLVSLFKRYDDYEHKDIHLELHKYYDSQYDQDILDIFKLLVNQIRSVKITVYQIKDEAEQPQETLDASVQRRESLVERVKEMMPAFVKVVEMKGMDCKKTYYNNSTRGVFHINDPKHGAIPATTNHLLWNAFEAPKNIPSGVKRVTLIYVYQTFLGSIFPQTVVSLFLESYNKEIITTALPETITHLGIGKLGVALSMVKLPACLKYLSIGKLTIQFSFEKVRVPATLSHLEINDPDQFTHHWLFSKGALPASVTHLRIGEPKINNKLSTPLLIPSTVQVMDLPRHPENFINYKIVDRQDYYQTTSGVPFTDIASIKHIHIDKPFLSALPSLPSTLESLDLTDNLARFDKNSLPRSLTSLKCVSYRDVPDHARLNYLETKILELDIIKVVFKVSDRSITLSQIPTTKDQFLMNCVLPMEHLSFGSSDLYTLSDILSPDVVIKRLTIASKHKLEIPNSVQYYEAYNLPVNYPASLKRIHLCSRYSFINSGAETAIYPVPSSVKVLIKNQGNPAKYLQFSDKYSKLCLEASKKAGHNNLVSVDSFLVIWRNKFLQAKINDSQRQPRYVTFKAEIVDGVRRLVNKTPIDSSGLLKVKVKSISPIPFGVTFFSIGEHEVKKAVLLALPSSVTKLKVSNYFDIKHDMIPPSVKHLVTTVLQKEIIPPHLEILEIRSRYSKSTLEELKECLPLTLKRVILSVKCMLNEDFLAQDKLDYLMERKLIAPGHCYYQGKTPISPSTTTLIWGLNEIIPVGVIPYGVKKILFCNRFNQMIGQDCIPESVTEIILGAYFTQCLSHLYLPVSLKYLSLGGCNHPIIPHSLPPNIVQIRIRRSFYHYKSLIHLPKSIKYVKFNSYRLKQDHNSNLCSTKVMFKSIYSNPQSEELKVIQDINESIGLYDQFVSTTTTTPTPTLCPPLDVDFHLDVNENLYLVPGLLDHFRVDSMLLDNEFNQCLAKGSLPQTLTKLVFTRPYQFIQETLNLPPNLRYLDFGKVSCSIESLVLPPTLTTVFLPSFVKPVSIPLGFLPHGLKSLHLRADYKNTIEVGVIPDTVEEVSMCQHADMDNLDFIPPSVTKLSLGVYKANILDCVSSSVTDLHIHPVSHNSYSIPANLIPTTITKLSVDQSIKMLNMDEIPNRVKELHLSDCIFTGIIPSTVQHIEIKSYNRELVWGK
ncbi:hypothetical protein CYY_008758 [Polysphondylium violaceum]|uniref:FNIP repeat-containing protein n=1 Tax=Polysphondylium violaceum TaxID=133409 RepID=A0A8J4PMK7_9MYCE|nr:hypothetical protein CYY_008758 [Polysphondylium violaceum]